ncbi:MAG: hypothetical protein M0Q42_03695 [Xanthomonadales bacterium]|nr:hypothetical protein [Xanthomonadales bacterium]
MRQPALTEQQLFHQFMESLRELPGVVAGPQDPRYAVGERMLDAGIELVIANKPVVLLIETRKAVFPRDVQQMLWRLREPAREGRTGQGEGTSLPLLIAGAISPGAKELLRNERIGYYDSGGSLYLPVPGAYIDIDKPAPKALAKSIPSLFTQRRAQVLHTLLTYHQTWFGVTKLAELAMVSPATTWQVLTGLERLDWLAVRGKGPGKQRRLREPTSLLDAWSRHLTAIGPPTLRRYFVPGSKGAALATRIGLGFHSHGVDYAISHEAAAQHYAPFLSSIAQVRVRVLIGTNADTAIGNLDARVVNEGANLVIIDTSSPGELLFRERVDGLWFASPIHVYLDLLAGEGRAKEMADHFRKQRVGF